MNLSPVAWRYGVAVLAVSTALGARLALDPVLGLQAPYLPFALAIMVAARWGGRGPGFAATGLSTLAVAWIFLQLHRLPLSANTNAEAGLALFVVVGSLMSLLVGALRSALLASARAEEGLRRQNQLVDLSHDAIVTLDPDWRIVRWNAGAEEMYGWTSAEAVGKVVHDLLRTAGDLVEEVHTTLRRDGRWEGELIHVARDGRRIWVGARQLLIRGASGLPDAILEINRDITKRKQAEAALRASEEQLRERVEEFEKLMEAAPVAIWVAQDPEGNRIVGNRTANTFYEAGDEENVSANVSLARRFFRDGRELKPEELPMQEAAAGNTEVRNTELDVLLPSGNWMYMLGSAIPLRDAQGRVRGCVAAFVDITARRRTEQALRESEERFRVAQELSPDGFTIFRPVRDTEGRVVDFTWVYENAAIARMNGTDPKEVAGRRLLEVLPGHRGTEFFRAYRHVAETGEQRIFEAGYSGEIPRPTWFRIAVVRMSGDIAVLAQDITERKRGEEALRKSEQRYRGLFESMQEGFVLGEVVCDSAGKPIDWRYLEVNPAMLSLLRRRRDEVVGHTYRERYPDAPWQYWVESLGAVALTGNPARLDHYGAAAGRHFEAIAYSPGRGQFAAIFTDVSERKRAAEELRRAQQANESQLAQLEAILRSMTDGLIMGDREGNVLSLNPAALALHGWSAVDEAGKHTAGYLEAFEVTDPNGRPLPARELPLARAARGEMFANRELRVRARDTGKEFLGSFSGTPVRDASGRQSVAIVTVRDVTEHKRAEEALRRAQKIESIGLLAGGVAHDFNNLLTVIMGSASNALEQCPSCEHSQAIISAAERAAYLTRQLLAYAGKGQFAVKDVDLTGLVASAKPLLAASVPKRVELAFDLAGGLPCIEADPTQIEQVLMNLVINAGEAIAPKADGRIEIATGVCPYTPEMALRRAGWDDVAAGSYVWLEVRDNGAGMDEATLSRIFDPFFSTKFTGRGLGLAAVDGIVRSSRGFIEVTTSVGGGTTFRVLLPAAVDRAPAAEPAPRAQTKLLRGSSTILVVDDEDMVRKLAAVILRRHGYEVLEASNGRHALEVLAGTPALPALVLLDLAMPVMGGDELVPILAERYPGLKIVVSSGYPEEDARSGVTAAPVAGFLQKPYTALSLAEKVDEILAGGDGGPVTAA